MTRSQSTRFLSVGVACLLILALCAACSSPLPGGEDAGVESETATAPGLEPLKIVTATQVPAGSEATASAASLTPTILPETYTVQEGDSLYSIAAKFNIDLASLVEVNGLSDPNDIQVGQELTLPRPAEQQQ